MPSWESVQAIGLDLPGVTVSTLYSTPALKVGGKGFARLRTESDGGLALMCGLDEKAALLASGDKAFYTTPHYDGYGWILLDLDRVDADHLAELIEDSWRLRATAAIRGQRP